MGGGGGHRLPSGRGRRAGTEMDLWSVCAGRVGGCVAAGNWFLVGGQSTGKLDTKQPPPSSGPCRRAARFLPGSPAQPAVALATPFRGPE